MRFTRPRTAIIEPTCRSCDDVVAAAGVVAAAVFGGGPLGTELVTKSLIGVRCEQSRLEMAIRQPLRPGLLAQDFRARNPIFVSNSLYFELHDRNYDFLAQTDGCDPS